MRLALAALLTASMFLVACNQPAKTTPVTTDDSSYPTDKSTTDTTGTTYQPTYTTTTVPPSDTGSSGYNTSATSPPVTTTVKPNSNVEMSGDESLAPSSGGKSHSSTARSSGGGQTYTVKSGDNLSKIAKKFYGDANKWNKIYNANKSRISNPNKLKPGTKLIIP